ncbi:6,7-dimethyl-8-ribityllumazine synthase [Basidiobolus meristosporus CBS 931.73]|uniref:6,7-dimethyl-8-ribityllumazine synthase n=1 Tax=Basidiobolus meristosporus CBS 931.73 TaxID=1314790 RepID=A0A1Y1ZCX6_9FUNG|nr:6,7-dimethyl-8-ribityllumazine synthase [Basidiobolus meristosporus CBS 931.73]|eukprot:ORY08108.1 6,7-dimethyl-8-ribityllumazine synthase [Basidiobolus meristosporus CBS 931.73]
MFEKGVASSTQSHDGSHLRVLIVHARWNKEIVDGLVEGARTTMISKHNVKPENIVTKEVSGSYELPFAAKRLISNSQVQSVTNNDLLGNDSPSEDTDRPFDAVICIGVLIKGSTMHFEYICEAVSQGLMRVGLDTGVPVIFGVLTCLNDEQALQRAGMGKGGDKGHNHGEDWGTAAVEMALLK